MNILIISSPNPLVTAGAEAINLATQMQELGHSVHVLTKYNVSNYPNFIQSYYGPLQSQWIKKIDILTVRIRKLLLHNRLNPLYAIQTLIQFMPIVNTGRILRLIKVKPDIVVVFFMQRFVNYIDLYRLQQKTQSHMFIVTPDMANFTGLCHFAYTCKGYENFCGYCPAICSTVKYDIAYFNFMSKRKYIDKMSLTALYWTSEIGANLAHSNLFRNKQILRVPLTTILEDSYHFAQADERNSRRAEYQIEPNDFVLGICAVDLRSTRKGIPDIIEAINMLCEKVEESSRIVVICAGKGDLPKPLLAKRIIKMGQVDKPQLAKLFICSDLFVSASIGDVGPATILLSMVCGTPVLSYQVGIAKEVISEGQNGYLVDAGDIVGLSVAMFKHYSHAQLDVTLMRQKSSSKGQSLFSPNRKFVFDKIFKETRDLPTEEL